MSGLSVEITFPLDFVVAGTPVSLQAKRAASRTAWKNRIRQASNSSLPEGHFCSEAAICVTLFYFPAARMEGDIDNIVKPVLDALCQHIYFDDRQVQRVWVQKFEPNNIFPFSAPSPLLTHAIENDKPLLYVRLSNDPAEGLT